MLIKKFLLLLFSVLLLASCGEVKNSRYRDTSHLETPPRMEIVERKKVDKAKDEKVKGLGNVVSLAGTNEQPVLKIKKLFDRSWNIVEQALQVGNIEVTDKNREQGSFYVSYDPDANHAGDQELVDKLTFFIFKDEYEEAKYKLSVVWRESDTEVSAKVVDQDNLKEMLEDDEDADDGDIDKGAKLIHSLYKIIRDDLPLN